MSDSPGSGPPPPLPRQQATQPTTALRQRLAELRGPSVAPQPLDARALAALAANPGCERRALLDGAGVNKTVLAQALGSPSAFGQSQFAFMRGNAFEARVKADGGAELMRLLAEHMGTAEPVDVTVPDLTAAGPEGRAARTALALREATEAGGWALFDHPMLALEVAGSPAYLEPDAVVVDPAGRWTVIEIKSFPMIDASADAAKVGAAARQSAVYVLALERIAAHINSAGGADSTESPGGAAGASVHDRILLVCPKDFSNLPTASAVDVRKQLSVTRRQLTRLTRIEDIAAALPEGTTFDPGLPPAELTAAVESVRAAYAPECLAACELAFHCRDRARGAGAVEALGRGVRGELGGLTTVDAVLAAAHGEEGDPSDPTVAALRRAAALRAEALAEAPQPAGRESAGRQSALRGADVQQPDPRESGLQQSGLRQSSLQQEGSPVCR
ncbi:hypothetical protein [Streptomyces sp. NBC_00932]|uniref:hypothetical protein n=1 Tax=Streptomyces sp. NBC_00932 TaxID=2903690 RepID=UPI00386A9809|nr:hypothetical protein OG221_25180 [Streptomyces sp. NBC_00932]